MVKKISIAVSTCSDSTGDVFANVIFTHSDSVASSDDEHSSRSVQHQQEEGFSPIMSNSFDVTASHDEHSPIPTRFRRRWSSSSSSSSFSSSSSSYSAPKNVAEERMKERLEYWKEGIGRFQKRLLENEDVDENFNALLTLANDIFGNNQIQADILYLLTQSESHKSIVWKFCSSLVNETIEIAQQYIFSDLTANTETISMLRKQYDNSFPAEMYKAMYKEMCKGDEYQRSDRLARFVIEVTKELPFKSKMTLMSDVLSILQLQYITKLKETMRTTGKEEQFVAATKTAAFLFWIGDVFLTPNLRKYKDAVLDDSRKVLKSVFNEFLKRNLLYFKWLEEESHHFESYSFFMVHFFKEAMIYYCDAPTVVHSENTKRPKEIVKAYVDDELSIREAIDNLNGLLADEKQENKLTRQTKVSVDEPSPSTVVVGVISSRATLWHRKNAEQLSESNDSGHEEVSQVNKRITSG